jgi:DNA end-binding protein Ku
VSRKTVSFNQIDSRSGARIRYQKVSGADGSEVPNEAIVKGYELPSGEYVLINDDELAALDPEAVRTIDIEEFESIPELDGLDEIDVSDRELAMAEQLIDSLSAEFDPTKFEDTYRNRVLDMIQRKAAGETEVVPAPQPVSTDKVVDLMAALEASVKAAKETRKRHPTARPADDKPADGEAAVPAKKPAAPRKRKSA